ncbi:MAG: NAD(P)H-dependent oxidoreductase subunit E [Chloroflexota bacterium]
MGQEYDEKTLDAIIQKATEEHGSGREAVIPILAEINQALGFVPAEAFGKIRRLVNKPEEGLFLADSHLFATASFYQMFSLTPTGRHVIRFCESAPCHVVGAREVVEAIQSHLGVEVGGTTADRNFTLRATSCLGICSVGPVFLVDDDMYGNVTPERVPGILAKYS